MYFKVEPTGCSERKGLIQVRYCLYLDPEDHGYEKHHVQVPVIPEGGYKGKLEDFKKWIDSLPKEWQNNPFVNHFVQFAPEEATDENIMFIGELALQMTYEKWVKDEPAIIQNQPVRFDLSASRKAVCVARVEQIKAATFEKAVKYVA